MRAVVQIPGAVGFGWLLSDGAVCRYLVFLDLLD